jgi:hypothetical protein
MALGQAILALALSFSASLATVRSWEDARWRIQLPLWFAIVPLLAGLGLILHVRLCRHVDRECPWVGLAWILLGLNLIALIFFTFSGT